jgi:hypothetical protein
MRIIEVFEAGEPAPHSSAAMPAVIRIDTSWTRATPFADAIPICLAGPGPATAALVRPASCKPQIGLGSVLSGHSGLVAIIAWRRNRSVHRVIRGRSLNCGVEIPIEPAAPLRRHPAGSFPEGFRTTAPVRVDRFVMGPSSETLYKPGWLIAIDRPAASSTTADVCDKGVFWKSPPRPRTMLSL